MMQTGLVKFRARLALINLACNKREISNRFALIESWYLRKYRKGGGEEEEEQEEEEQEEEEKEDRHKLSWITPSSMGLNHPR